MNERESSFYSTSYYEQGLSDPDAFVELVECLEQLFPPDYMGDTEIPIDPSMLELVDSFTSALWPNESHERKRALLFPVYYRTLELAYSIVRMLQEPSDEAYMDMDSILLGVKETSHSSVIDEIYEIGAVYLAQCPNLDTIVEQYAGVISPHPSLDYISASMTGIWLKAFHNGALISEYLAEIDER